MGQILVALISGAGGTAIGCLFTWILTTRAARNQVRREALVSAAKALQDYRVAYAHWYTEYLSSQAPASETWARPATGKPDPLYLQMMSDVDIGRGHLRVIQAILYAHFREEEINALWKEIAKVLAMSAPESQVDCREVECVAEAACDLIPDIIRRYH